MNRYLALFAALFSIGASAAKPWAASQSLSKITGLNRPANWRELTKFYDSTKFPVKVAELPKAFDWTTCAVFPPVNRQANNDCWAQGSTGVIELIATIVGELGTERLSVQATIDCSDAGSASNGGYWAFEFMKSMGLPFLKNYPYTGRDNRCRSYDSAFKVVRWGNVGGRNRYPTADEVKQAMYAYGPVGSTIYANGALQSFRGAGVVNSCAKGRTNHIEVLVAWKTDEQGRTLWKVRNSWGESHGDRGYAWIQHDCLWAGSEDVTFAVVAPKAYVDKGEPELPKNLTLANFLATEGLTK